MQEFTHRQIEIMEAATNRISKFGIQNLTIKTLAEDIGLSEPALYRHFKSKNEILWSLLEYFKTEMKNRIQSISFKTSDSEADKLRAIFNSQLQTFVSKPAIVSVIFAESIFHYEENLSNKVAEIMDMMQDFVKANIKRGQELKQYNNFIGASILTTIIIGGMRMTVLKWKLSNHKSNLVKDGKAVLEGILKMIEK
ncbi:MAG TPA: TetR/AcrR family transcriptional regulator [Chitinophagaceae bacterium]|jgi:AcrR family transcriptional regulator|nr:TetR/AcrR family transcriptional regulator [Chitinophagaceae bacterium]OPZ17713.1 MAG: Nucleoid occlusion factor SlmA [Bacteroidetes bacterium ADurb.BinA245]HNC37773.1 TetR/AcrR family transcriptional regulator [Chitinophagaceae bacterium]HND94223.1 TetR/AcrR family transcriptional regulator [Chitinophagaceae bacterium]HNF39228.1 TetR/AcrR family transcriptional regulator [Chitinophagaceae bacterium]